MYGHLLAAAARLSDDALFERVESLVGRERDATVELVAHLAELIARKTDLGEGWGPVFEYCRARLHLSEDAAYNRVAAARAVRLFPVILDRLADGSVNVTTVRILRPVLTAENHLRLLAEARHRRKTEVEEIVARVAPRPDVKSSIRKLPAASAPTAEDLAATGGRPRSSSSADLPPAEPAIGEGPTAAPAAPAAPVAHSPARRPVVEALAPSRYGMHVTIGQEARDALRLLQDLLAHQIPTGDVSAIVEDCLIARAREVLKRKAAVATRPGKRRGTKEGSRAVEAHVRRVVWKRDGGRCTSVGRHGRCTQRRFLEYHHIHPYALGGPASVGNITLRCRAHNAYESEQVFGPHGMSAVGKSRGNHAVSGEIAPFQNGGNVGAG